MTVFVRAAGLLPGWQNRPIDLSDDAATVRQLLTLLRDLDPAWDAIYRDDRLHSDVVILLDGRNIAILDGLDTRIADGAEILVTVPISGG